MFQKNKIQSLTKKSQQALGVFRTTSEKLLSINDSLQEEKVYRLDTIEQLKSEVAEIQQQQDENREIIVKLTDFLGV